MPKPPMAQVERADLVKSGWLASLSRGASPVMSLRDNRNRFLAPSATAN